MGVDSNITLHKSVPLKTIFIAWSRLFNPHKDINQVAKEVHETLKTFTEEKYNSEFHGAFPLHNKDIQLTRSPFFHHFSNAKENIQEYELWRELDEEKNIKIKTTDYTKALSGGSNPLHMVCMKKLVDLLGGFTIFTDTNDEISHYNLKPIIKYSWHHDPSKINEIKSILDDFILEPNECHEILEKQSITIPENISSNDTYVYDFKNLINFYKTLQQKEQIEKTINFQDYKKTKKIIL